MPGDHRHHLLPKCLRRPNLKVHPPQTRTSRPAALGPLRSGLWFWEPMPPGPSWRRSLRHAASGKGALRRAGRFLVPAPSGRASGRRSFVRPRWRDRRLPAGCPARAWTGTRCRLLFVPSPPPFSAWLRVRAFSGFRPGSLAGVRARRLYSESVAACLWGTPRHVTCARTLVTPHGHVHVSLPARVASHFSTRHKRRAAALDFFFFLVSNSR